MSKSGSVVGIKAKSKADCKWTPLKVEFYRALRRCHGGVGTSEQIAKSSKGKISAGNARHFGYHGVGGGLVRIEEEEGVRGFTFHLTAKGRNVDLDKALENGAPVKKAKDKSSKKRPPKAKATTSSAPQEAAPSAT